MNLFLYFLLINAITYLLYWADKRAAINGTWRVSEAMLLGAGFAGGTLAAIAAQQKLRHKTRKRSFQLAFWAVTAVQLWFLFFPPFILAPFHARVFG